MMAKLHDERTPFLDSLAGIVMFAGGLLQWGCEAFMAWGFGNPIPLLEDAHDPSNARWMHLDPPGTRLPRPYPKMGPFNMIGILLLVASTIPFKLSRCARNQTNAVKMRVFRKLAPRGWPDDNVTATPLEKHHDRFACRLHQLFFGGRWPVLNYLTARDLFWIFVNLIAMILVPFAIVLGLFLTRG